ncbi:MAG: group II intron maturase-specific domain-containing protein [Bacteroidales bacterium]
MRGWINYYKLADMKTHLQRVDECYRRRLRMCIWKCWKKVKTKFQDLMKCGIGQGKSWEWANTRKSYWRTSKSPILTQAITNENLRLAGYPSLSAYYAKLYRN